MLQVKQATSSDSSSNNTAKDPHPFITLYEYMAKDIVGQETLVERLLIGLLCEGHLLIEGLPGLAKTTTVHHFAKSFALDFSRIQFTPDLIPGDITGSDIFLPQEGAFKFLAGPIFNEVVLADEINRAPPKVQSALLEAMQEHQVTTSGKTRPLPDTFMVIATQNPIEHEGTYPLPEAQLDRFMMKVNVNYPTPEQELEILQNETLRQPHSSAPKASPSLNRADIATTRKNISSVYMDEMLQRYIIALVSATRKPEDSDLANWINRGASPRASLALSHAAKAKAYLSGRDFVEPGDIIMLAPDILNHRLSLSFSAHSDNVTSKDIVDRLIDLIPIP